MSTYGLYTFRPFLNISGDLNAVNDSLAPINRTSNLVPGNVISNILQLCVSGQPTLSVSGAYGGGIQWQSAPTILGPWTNVGSPSPTYFVSPAISQNTFYRVEVGCNGTTATSNTVEIVVNNPQIISTLPDSVCAPASAVLQAAAAPGSVVRWFANQTGGTPLFVGSAYTTPVLKPLLESKEFFRLNLIFFFKNLQIPLKQILHVYWSFSSFTYSRKASFWIKFIYREFKIREQHCEFVY
jgi:hypothetical protein